MKKEWTLFLVSGTLTLAIALLLIRWLAPGLLGIPVDLQMVQVEKRIPPFFDGIFRQADQQSNFFILQDPLSKIRAHPLVQEQGMNGPHDLLGFRNRQVPNTADLIVIGDSQTYGVNVPLDFNWPSETRKALKNKQVSVYNMSVGGWGGIQYYYIFRHALNLNPRAVIVAFYTGNDALESFSLAYGSEIWKEFRLNPQLNKSDVPPVEFPPGKEDLWSVTFHDGIKTVFAPKLRLSSNLDHPAIRTGYEILALVAKKISVLAKPYNLPVFFTLIPSKELVYALKIKSEGIDMPSEYSELVTNEKNYIEWLKKRITALANVRYVDLVTPLQQRALLPAMIYPENSNGHPFYDGYFFIGNTLARHIDTLLPTPPSGLAFRQVAPGHTAELYFVKGRQYWIFSSPEIARANGWDLDKKGLTITYRDIAGYEYMGVINKINRQRFGP